MSDPPERQKGFLRRHRRGLLGLVALIAACFAVPVTGPMRWRYELSSKLSTVDRIVVDTGVFPVVPPEMADFPAFEITGREQVQAFVELVEFKPRFLPLPWKCRCPGDALVTFHEESKSAMTLSIVHGKAFRWRRHNLRGDTELTEESAAALANWLQANGIPPLEQLSKQAWEQRFGDHSKTTDTAPGAGT